MRDFVFVFFTIFVITGLIYILYKIMLSADKQERGNELQITPAEMLQQLDILMKQQKYSIVETLAKTYLKSKPADADVRTILAKALYEMGATNEAIEQAKVVAKNQPRNYKIKIFLANCYERNGEPNKAINMLEDVLTRDSNNVVAIKNIAGLYLKNNQKLSGIKMYKRLEDYLESTHEKAKNKTIIADTYIELSDYPPAIEEYLEILEMYPDDIGVKKRLVNVYRAMYKYDDLITIAFDILNTALIEEDRLFALNALLFSYESTKDYDKALEIAGLINESPLSNTVESGENIAAILLQKEQLGEGIELLESLILQDPSNISLRKKLATAFEMKKDFDKTEEIYKEILDIADLGEIEQIHSEMSNFYASWGEYLFQQGDNSECFKKFTTALQYYDKNPEAYCKLGNVNKEIKNFNESISHYKKAIELDPHNPEYYSSLADCYEEIGTIYEQKRVLLESIKYNPDNALLNYKLAIIANCQNDLASAISYMNKAIELDKDFVDAKFRLALMFEHIGNKDDAINLYGEVLKLEPTHQEAINNLKMLKSF